MELYIVSGISLLVILYFAIKPRKCNNCGTLMSKDFDHDIKTAITRCSNCGHEESEI